MEFAALQAQPAAATCTCSPPLLCPDKESTFHEAHGRARYAQGLAQARFPMGVGCVRCWLPVLFAESKEDAKLMIC